MPIKWNVHHKKGRKSIYAHYLNELCFIITPSGRGVMPPETHKELGHKPLVVFLWDKGKFGLKGITKSDPLRDNGYVIQTASKSGKGGCKHISCNSFVKEHDLPKGFVYPLYSIDDILVADISNRKPLKLSSV